MSSVYNPVPEHLSLIILEGRALSRTYRLGAARIRAVADVDLGVSAGELVVLQGPSGSGKTTLINLLGLLDRPDGGQVFLDGRPVGDLDEAAVSDLRRDRLGFVFQSFNLIPVLSASENVEYPMALRQIGPQERRRRAHGLLARVGLQGKEDVRPDLLSGGERQRVAIARAIANEPRVVLADEPTANLDSATAGEVLHLMRELTDERGLAIVVATHDPRVVARARRVVTLSDGRVVGEA
jgi:putative ABC transport system ATP-binding protein